MSFILDALKKADKNRQRGQVDRPVGRRVIRFSSQQKFRWWLWVPLAGLLIVLTVIWMVVVDTKEPVAVRPAVAPPATVLTRDNPIAAPVPKVFQKQGGANRVTESGSALLADKVVDGGTDAVQSEPVMSSIASEGSTAEWPTYQDLSAELKNRLPDLTITLHYYTDQPERRLVRINNQLLHEGDRLNDAMRIETITANGVRINYDGIRFELQSALK
ncbi:MAG: general secretion pathway protein GspB [Deltaproteobacteria bacterium]|jgi:general secretion pathway protein B|nr:general secretion pathway protein GspB [Deltaproteobacteria bacterium]